jgi:ElaB/YqjD/DUF883 family membrane-anchored ribosome-binding protein
MEIESFRTSMSGDVLHSWAADAQKEIQRLRAKLESTTEDRDLWKRSAQRLARDIEAVRAERAVLAGDGWKEWRA